MHVLRQLLISWWNMDYLYVSLCWTVSAFFFLISLIASLYDCSFHLTTCKYNLLGTASNNMSGVIFTLVGCHLSEWNAKFFNARGMGYMWHFELLYPCTLERSCVFIRVHEYDVCLVSTRIHHYTWHMLWTSLVWFHFDLWKKCSSFGNCGYRFLWLKANPFHNITDQ